MNLLQLASFLLASHATTADQSILDIAKSDGTFSTLVAALDASGLAHTFDDVQYKSACLWWSWLCPEYTLFAPTNDAFAALPDGVVDRLLQEEFGPHLKDLLRYHAVEGKILSSEIEDGKVGTLNGEDVEAGVDEDGGITLNNDAQVTTPDIEASNGVVHVIDKVLLPQSAMFNIAEIATEADFTTLVSLLTAVDLAGFVSDAGEVLTIFAPTNAAFDKLIEDGFDATDLDAVEELLKYHVVQGEVKTSHELLHEGDVETVQGSIISVDWAGYYGKSFKLNEDVGIVKADILASNGIIHAIDTVLTIPEPLGDIASVASGNPDFSLLVEALAKADLVDTLTGAGPFTVFAPTNAAFEKAGITSDYISDTPGPDLAPILLYHVLVDAKALADDITSGIIRTGLAPTNLLVDVKNSWWHSQISLNKETKVKATDVLASNGVIHVIDTVLLPPGNIVEVATDKSDTFSTLLELLTKQGVDLAETLEGDGPFTVFAPTNDAFEKLGEVDLTDEELTNVLLYHVVPDNVPLSALPEGDVGTAFAKGGVSQTVDVSLRRSWWGQLKVFVKGDANLKKSKVAVFDVLAANGIIHAIDEVLLPKLE